MNLVPPIAVMHHDILSPPISILHSWLKDVTSEHRAFARRRGRVKGGIACNGLGGHITLQKRISLLLVQCNQIIVFIYSTESSRDKCSCSKTI